MSDDFAELLRELVGADVRFLIVGAHALAAHGVPRVTGDLDVWVDPTDANAARVSMALARFGAPLHALGLTPGDFTQHDQVIQIGLPPYRVDVLTSISGVAFADAWEDRLTGTLFGVEAPFLGRNSFIQNKRASGRPKDLEDLRSLGV